MDLSKTPVLYSVKKKRKIIKAIIPNAVKIFFFLVFLSGVIILSYLSEKEQKPKINIKLNIQILILPFSSQIYSF